MEHILIKQDRLTFDCTICKEKVVSKKRLDSLKMVPEGLGYKCHECDGVFTTKSYARIHVRSVRKGLRYKFDICRMKFRKDIV